MSYADVTPRVCGVLQDGGNVKVEVVIGAPQRGPYHLALRHANPGTLFTGTLQPLVVSPSPVQLGVSLVPHVQLKHNVQAIYAANAQFFWDCLAMQDLQTVTIAMLHVLTYV